MNRIPTLEDERALKKSLEKEYEESRKLWRTWLRRGGFWGLFFILGFSIGYGSFFIAFLVLLATTALVGYYYG